MHYDVAIVGGGVVGSAIARELSKYRVRTVLLDKECEVGFGTSKSNSGIIHAGHHSSPDTLKGSLVVDGCRDFPELAKELNFGYRQVGEIVVAKNANEVPTLQMLLERGRKKGVPGLELWDHDHLLADEPNLSHDLVGGLFAPTAGVINPYEYCFNLVENARQNGVELKVDSEVLRIDRRGDIFALQTPNELVHAHFIINAAGVYAAKIAAMVGLHDFIIRPRRGEEYMLDKRMKGVVRRVIFPVPTGKSKGMLIIPTFDGTIMIGPTAEDQDSFDDVSTTEGSAQKVFDSARSIVPSIHPRDTIAEFAGLRAVSDTNDFIIGTTSVKGFINVAGIQSPGLTAAPAIARYVRDILGDEGLELSEKLEFEPNVEGIPRFSALSEEERFELIEKDPHYARIVCRCEEVTEREVLDAIDRGGRTLDGLKFRVRAGMGRCQGGFCAWRCMELLGERLGTPPEEVTKRGDGSWLVCQRDEHEGADQ